MWGSEIIDVVLAVVFVYILLSLSATMVTEAVSRLLKWRHKDLQKGIGRMLSDGTREKVFNHPFIRSLTKGDRPSYIPAHTFAMTVMDIAARSDTKDPESAKISTIVETDSLSILYSMFGDDLTKLTEKIETWFDDVMDRVSGWYKRKTQMFLFIFGLIIAILMNADTISLVSRFSQDDTLRNEVVAAVEEIADEDSLNKKEMAELRTKGLSLLDDFGVFGWGEGIPKGFWNWIYKILGILLTSAAISLGAPFWFDLVGKVVSLRSTGKKPETAAEERRGR